MQYLKKRTIRKSMSTAMKHLPPILFYTISFILGICWKANNNAKILFPLILAIIIIIATIQLTKKNNIIKCLLTTFLTFALGALIYQNQQEGFSLFYERFSNLSFDIIETIKSVEKSTNKTCRIRLMLSISSIKQRSKNSKWKTINENVFIYTSKSSASLLAIDDKILLKKISFKRPTNESFNSFLIKEECVASLFLPKLYYRRIKHPKLSPRRYLHNLKCNLLSRIKRKLGRNSFNFYSAIFLGYPIGKKNLKTIKQRFKEWGIMHYLARSGLHLIFFILILSFLFSIIPLPLMVKELTFIILITIYTALSWASIPFNRALSLFVIQKTGRILNLQVNPLHIFSLICLITLAINPIQLFHLDFQLSFGITFALILFNAINTKK